MAGEHGADPRTVVTDSGSATPAISVIIPTFNRAGLVERAVQSVLSQSMRDFELIVVDDGSTDDSLERLAGISDKRLQVLSQGNMGVCAARNRGIREATADFVTWLDSDDLAEPGWLEFFTNARAEGAALASCGSLGVAPDGTTDLLAPAKSGPAFGGLSARFLAGSFAIDRQLLLEVGGFRDGLEYSEHTDLALRLGGYALQRPVPTATTSEPLVRRYLRHETIDPQVRYSSAATIVEHDSEHLRRSSGLYATYLAIAGSNASKLGRRREACAYLARAIKARPTRARNWARLARAVIGSPSGSRRSPHQLQVEHTEFDRADSPATSFPEPTNPDTAPPLHEDERNPGDQPPKVE